MWFLFIMIYAYYCIGNRYELGAKQKFKWPSKMEHIQIYDRQFD